MPAQCASGPAACVALLSSRLAAGEKYHQLRAVLRLSLASAAPSPALFAVGALEHLVASLAAVPEAEHLAPLPHLMLEALASVEPWARGASRVFSVLSPGSPPEPLEAPRCPAAAARAAALLAAATGPGGASSGVDARAALRIAQTFALTAADVAACGGAEAASQAFAFTRRLFSDGQYTPAVLLALQLRGGTIGPVWEEAEGPMDDLDAPPEVASSGAFPQLLAARQEALAETLAAALGGTAPAALIRACLAMKLYRAAHAAARRFRLLADFPEAARLHAQSTLGKLAARGLWEAAAGVAGVDLELRRMLLAAAATAGEAGVALELAERFGLAAEVDAAGLAWIAQAAAAADAAIYLQPALPEDAVQWVSHAGQLPALRAALAAAPAVGLDAEWRAETGRPFSSVPEGPDVRPEELAGFSRVALLQLATADAVFLLDIPALAADSPAALSQALEPLLATSPAPALLLGYGVVADVAKCGASYPHVPALAQLGRPGGCRALELRDLYRHARPSASPLNAVPLGGLSGLCDAVLGRPMDKRPRMSDWERRPLTSAQMRYAALDAHAAVRLLHALCPAATEPASFARAALAASGTVRAPKAAELPPLAEAPAEALLPLGPADVVTALEASGVTGWSLLQGPADADGSCAAAAAAIDAPLCAIVKSLGCVATGGSSALILLLLRGSQRADLALAADAAGLPRRGLRLATAAECVAAFGYPPGSMPPVGLRRPGVTVLADVSFQNDSEVLYAGAGDATWHLAAPAHVLLALAAATVAPIAAPPQLPPPPPPAATAPAAAPVVESAVAFVVDGALFKLGRWLRCLGVDVAFVQTQARGAHVAALRAAMAEPSCRILLTTDAGLLARACAGSLAASTRAVLLAERETTAQLEELRRRFALAFDSAQLLSRCAACGGRVALRRTPAEMVADATLPVFIREAAATAPDTAPEVWGCDTCGKAYWVGPKSRRAVALVASLGDTATLFGEVLEGGSQSGGLAAQIREVLAERAALA